MDQRIQKVTTRLIISTIVFLILQMLSGIVFYYLHAQAPIVPLVVVLMASPAAAIMLMSYASRDLRLLKRKKSQQVS